MREELSIDIDMPKLGDTNVVVNNSLASQVDDYKETVVQDTINSVLKTIEINDSFFYAKMVVYKSNPMEDPFSDKVNVVIEMNLFNSKDFEHENLMSDKQFVNKARKIKTTMTIDKDRLQDKADAMGVVYKIVADKIAQELFFRNIDKVDMIVNKERKYI